MYEPLNSKYAHMDALMIPRPLMIMKNRSQGITTLTVKQLRKYASVQSTLISNYLPVSESVNHTDRYSMQSISQPCSTAHTPTAEPQAQLTPTDTPTVKREYV